MDRLVLLDLCSIIGSKKEKDCGLLNRPDKSRLIISAVLSYIRSNGAVKSNKRDVCHVIVLYILVGCYHVFHFLLSPELCNTTVISNNLHIAVIA